MKTKLDKVLLVVFIIFLIVGISTLLIVLNKGNIFGHRLVSISGENVERTIHHTIQMSVDRNIIPKDDENGIPLLVTIDGHDVTEGYTVEISDEEILKFEDGLLLAQNEIGKATVKVISDEFNVEVQEEIETVEPITKLDLKCEFRTIDIDEEAQLEYTFKPQKATPKIVYTTSDETVATVDENGVAKGVSTGNVIITATDLVTGIESNYKLKVKELKD